ncbi:uncharacterized protein K02A2.6-like [Ahaetulla prasina]|uniref:uncharacterized protein K02A2.6-like n=1 Tax=Ahaetulla prasina TaxID=499056 RepID=UPI0026493D87|nr:uncharacterized protein K02A2.6-like [Ahaetulla prasina]
MANQPVFGPFEPAAETWDDFIERFECYLQANDYTEMSKVRKKGYFLSFCGREMFKTAKALVAPQQLRDVPWEVLLDKLTNHYAPAPSRIARRHVFRRRFQRDGESIADFIASLRSAASQCDFSDLDDALLEQLVNGVRDMRLQRRLLARRELTLTSAIDEAQASEMSEKSASELQSFNTSRGPPSAESTVHQAESEGTESSDDSNSVSRLRAAQKKKRAPTAHPFTLKCAGCGEKHDRATCRFKTTICLRCGKRGHLAKVCRATLPTSDAWGEPTRSRKPFNKPFARRTECHEVNHATATKASNKLYLTVNLEGVPCKFEVDTGSSKSLISWAALKQVIPKLSKSHLKQCDVSLRDYQGHPIPIEGCDLFNVSHGRFSGRLPLVVVKGNLPSLLGLDWFEAFGLNVLGIHSTTAGPFEDVLQEFSDVFDGKLGEYKGKPVSFHLDPQIAPIRLKARRVPFALRQKVDLEIDRLIAQGVLEQVEHSPWETPIVVPIKQDGSIRICADYKGTINRALQANPYPVPVVQHLLHSLGQGTLFAKLDLAQAYQQLPVDEATAMAQTIVTHRGAFKCKRLQFGVSVAPGLFQSLMERLLHGLEGVVPYFDDILISAINHADLRAKLSDHKPLLGLLAGDRQTPPILSPRMSRWTEFLAAYNYRLAYRPGRALGHADALSRCPLPTAAVDPAPASTVLLIDEWQGPVSASDIARLTAKDPTLSRVLDWVRRGWPAVATSPEFLPFQRRQHELSVLKGCLLWGTRVVVPAAVRAPVLDSLHNAHPGIVRMKALGRSYVWWPKLDHDIELWVSRCQRCQLSRPDPPAATVREWEVPRAPWSRIHLDFAGPYMGQNFLVIVDAYSRWVEVTLMPSTTAEATIRVLEKLFATHGLPDVVVSDNGPQFAAAPFQIFLAKHGIRHAPTAPFHPAANGRAERAVRSVKETLGRLRRIRTALDRLHPVYCPDQRPDWGGDTRTFKAGDPVFARNYGSPLKWAAGHIISITGPCSYRVRLVDGREWRRHINQLRGRMTLPQVEEQQHPSPHRNDYQAPRPRLPEPFDGQAPVPPPTRKEGHQPSEPEAFSSENLPEEPGSRSSTKPASAAPVRPGMAFTTPPLPSAAPELRRSGRSRRRPAYLADYACANWEGRGVESWERTSPARALPTASGC